MLPRIKKIIEKDQFRILCLWNTGEEKWIDFEPFLRKQEKNSVFLILLDPEIFGKVQCDGRTLYWENLVPYEDLDHEVRMGVLDICPDVLYEWDQKKENEEIVEL